MNVFKMLYKITDYENWELDNSGVHPKLVYKDEFFIFVDPHEIAFYEIDVNEKYNLVYKPNFLTWFVVWLYYTELEHFKLMGYK